MGKPILTEKHQIVITGSVGLSGAYTLLREYYEKLHERYSCDFLEPVFDYPDLFSCQREREALKELPYACFAEASYGGIFGALFQLVYEADMGIRVDLKRIPVCQQVIEIAEYFQINPYLLHSAGSLVIAAQNGEKLVEELRKRELKAVVAGRVTREKARIAYLENEERFLVPPRKDALLSCLEEGYVKQHFPKKISIIQKGDGRILNA